MAEGWQKCHGRDRFPDDRLAIADLLERWNLGLGQTIAERRMILRLSREQAAIEVPETEDDVISLPSVRKALGESGEPREKAAEEPQAEYAAEMGDDDEVDLEDLAEDEDFDEDFYADALEDV